MRYVMSLTYNVTMTLPASIWVELEAHLAQLVDPIPPATFAVDKRAIKAELDRGEEIAMKRFAPDDLKWMIDSWNNLYPWKPWLNTDPAKTPPLACGSRVAQHRPRRKARW